LMIVMLQDIKVQYTIKFAVEYVNRRNHHFVNKRKTGS
jgi:hypothetical protein